LAGRAGHPPRGGDAQGLTPHGAATQQIVASILRTCGQQDRDPLVLLIALQRAPHPVVADFDLD
jgi:hypothetical protein